MSTPQLLVNTSVKKIRDARLAVPLQYVVTTLLPLMVSRTCIKLGFHIRVHDSLYTTYLLIFKPYLRRKEKDAENLKRFLFVASRWKVTWYLLFKYSLGCFFFFEEKGTWQLKCNSCLRPPPFPFPSPPPPTLSRHPCGKKRGSFPFPSIFLCVSKPISALQSSCNMGCISLYLEFIDYHPFCNSKENRIFWRGGYDRAFKPIELYNSETYSNWTYFNLISHFCK